MREGLIKDSEEIIKKELQEANKNFRAFASAHEGYAVTLEELEELKEKVAAVEEGLKNLWKLTKENGNKATFESVLADMNADAVQLVAEATQTAAMIQKFQQFNRKRV